METNVSATRLDVYQIVTDRIIELLEKGTVPWRIPWKQVGLPMNLISGRSYRGINLWLLLSLNYEQNLFLTWDQIKKVGASVNKGEHGHIVVFWKRIDAKDQPEKENAEPKKVPLLRYYKVFNINQLRDLPNELLQKHASLEISLDESSVTSESDVFFVCERIIKNMPLCPTIRHKEQMAYYHVTEDFINMPKKKSFISLENYYLTLFHELVHSTGHERRLNRTFSKDIAETGGEMYSLEELVAEMGASYLASHSDILSKTINDSAAYIKGWLEKLRNDKRMVLFASGHAQKAVEFILDEKHSSTESNENDSSEC